MNDNFVMYLIFCFCLSFLIGIERQYRRRLIGLRTSILVSLGSFLFVSFSFSVGSTDISRIASQVVTGIGFLGAGVILKDGKKISGLTTAATLWCDAAIGILCAGGALKEAIWGTGIILFSNIILRYINQIVNSLSDKNHSKEIYNLVVTISTKDSYKVQEEIIKVLQSLKIEYDFQTKNKKDCIMLNYIFPILKKSYPKIEFKINELNNEFQFENLKLNKINEIKVEELEEEL